SGGLGNGIDLVKQQETFFSGAHTLEYMGVQTSTASALPSSNWYSYGAKDAGAALFFNEVQGFAQRTVLAVTAATVQSHTSSTVTVHGLLANGPGVEYGLADTPATLVVSAASPHLPVSFSVSTYMKETFSKWASAPAVSAPAKVAGSLKSLLLSTGDGAVLNRISVTRGDLPAGNYQVQLIPGGAEVGD